MSHGISFLGSQADFHYSHQATKSTMEPSSSSSLSLNKTTLFSPKPSFSLESRIGFSRRRRRPQVAASAVNSNYVIAGAESFYDLLGISETGSLSDIKQAYKQLARKYHPDVSPPECIEEHTKRFLQVQEAYEILSDPKARALYDRNMTQGLHLAFSAGRRFRNKEDLDEKYEWKSRWQSQLQELDRKSKKKSKENMSWAARVRTMQATKG